MPLDEILLDLLARTGGDAVDVADADMSTEMTDSDGVQVSTADRLVLALEKLVNSKYRDPGTGIHFVGLLLTLFAAEMVSAYWRREGHSREGLNTMTDPARMLSALYSNDFVAFVLSHPTETTEKITGKVAWRNDEQNGFDNQFRQSRRKNDCKNAVFTVSAAIHIPSSTQPEKQRVLPFYGCPRRYSDLSNYGEAVYVHQRFTEADLSPTFTTALATSSIADAIDAIFDSQSLGNGSLKTPPPIDPTKQSEFFMDQFARGYGVEIKWLTDSQRLRNAELEIDSDQRLASSKVIGLFGSTLRSNILFKQNNLIGVYFPTSKEHSLLSRNADFFEAGIKFSSIFSEPETPMSAEPQGLSPSTQMELVTDTDKINSYLNLPSNISLFPFPDQKREIPQTPMLPAESPSFFSPSFADHISTSTSSRHDPRVHTINIPFQLHSPIRSQSYPTTPSPARGNAHNSGSYSSMGRSKTHRSVRRSSNSPPPNTTAILGRDLETLLATGDFLIIDIRSFAVYAKSRIINAINVCIPTVLLKRKSLSVDDISESIVSKNDRGRFAKWKEADGIVIYDADSLRVQDSYPLTTLAGKFLEAGFKKTTYGLIGGFAGLSDTPKLIDTSLLSQKKSSSESPNSAFFPSSVTTNAAVDATKRLTLECQESALFTRSNTTKIPGAPAFFSNIRQNMDLHGGVGPLIPINAPTIQPSIKAHLPKWLNNVAYSPSGPAILARRWEQIELAEKRRLESVLTGQGMEGRFSISAAMERGEKNRYSNIWPFEWNRVKIPNAGMGQDYFNGSLIQHGNRQDRRYIATQAPLPGTFEDFWKVVWGEGVQIIMALTAKEEGGQVKCHPYWMESNAGQMHITLMHEKIVSLGPGQNVFMRTFMLRNGAEPFNPMREIVMLHYEGWPDFGAPAQPATILSLVEMLNDIVAQRSRGIMSTVLMHCSAGCGRTGTFCTIDSLIDHLDLTKDGVDDDDDIIYQTVLAFREQRMSMVQTLRQYVLCYECVLHHLLNKLSSEDNRMKIG